MAFTSRKGRQGVQQAAAGGYSIDNSLRFNDDDSAYLSRTPSSAGNRKTWTWSGWVKRGNLAASSSTNWFFGGGATNNTRIGFHQSAASKDDLLVLYFEGISGGDKTLYSSRLFRDSSAWYHIAVVVDTTQSTASDRVKLYINNELETLTGSYPATQNADTGINGTDSHGLGTDNSTGLNGYFDGYLAEVHFIDGQALDPTSFGETGDYGEWKPIEVTGMNYGTNGFYLDFANKGTKHTVTANGDVQHSTAQSKIDGSSIYFDGTGDYLTIPDHSDWDLSPSFTIECWLRIGWGVVNNWHSFLATESGVPGGGPWGVLINTRSDEYNIWFSDADVYWTFDLPENSWVHLAIVGDGSNVTCYRNGVACAIKQGTSSYSSINPPVGDPLKIGAADLITDYLGYIDEFRISNIERYTTTFTPSTTAFTEDSNTLLLIHSDTTNGSTTFTDDSGVVGGLGNDASSNTNNWTVNNLAATDQMLDTPTNNFCTLNPLDSAGVTLSEGNLKSDGSNSGVWGWKSSGTISSDAITDNKFYFECYLWDAYGDFNANGVFGVAHADVSLANRSYGGGGWTYAHEHGYYYLETGSPTGSGATGGGGIAMCAYDGSTGKLWFGREGTWNGSGNPATGANPVITLGVSDRNVLPFLQPYRSGFILNFGQDSSFAGNKTAQGNQDSNSIGDFYYTPPTDFLALCTSNLPDPAVIPSEHFNTVLYTGDGSTSRAITGVGFQPDLAWVKSRSSASWWHVLTDSVRGGGFYLHSNNTNAEGGGGTSLITGFNSDGFNVNLTPNGTVNNNLDTYVAWNWKANGTGVSNTSGSITSTVSANADAGFSIVSYTGNGTANQTVGHGLSKTPEIIIIKGRENAYYWSVINPRRVSTSNTNMLYLNVTNAEADDINIMGDNLPTATTFGVDDYGGVNVNNLGFIAYCFHSVDGYSKMGSYTGNGSADGTFVYTGFRPAYVMAKRTTGAQDWIIFDGVRSPYNVSDDSLAANSSAAESTADSKVDFLSNGFKSRYGSSNFGGNNDPYIYLAFAEYPFKHTNAR